LPKRPRRAGRPAARGHRRVFVDSGAWLAFFSARDQNHAAAVALVRRAVESETELVTTNLVLAEVHRLVLHRVGIGAAAMVLGSIEASAHLRLVFPAADHHRAARRWLSKLSDQAITYTDAISFTVIEIERCAAAIAFDHDFVIAGFELWQP
jgi:predicted nucleic acid-binding protein